MKTLKNFVLAIAAWAMMSMSALATDVIVVSHAFAIYSILCRALDMPLKNYGRLRLMPGTISILEAKKNPGDGFIDTKWTLTQLNSSPSQGKPNDP